MSEQVMVKRWRGREIERGGAGVEGRERGGEEKQGCGGRCYSGGKTKGAVGAVGASAEGPGGAGQGATGPAAHKLDALDLGDDAGPRVL